MRDLRWSGKGDNAILLLVPGSDAERVAWRKRLGYALARCRDATGLTQEDAAAKLDVNPQTISRWENGKNELRAYDLARIARLYEVPREWIVDPPDSLTEIQLRLAQRADRAIRQGLSDDERPQGGRRAS